MQYLDIALPQDAFSEREAVEIYPIHPQEETNSNKIWEIVDLEWNKLLRHILSPFWISPSFTTCGEIAPSNGIDSFPIELNKNKQLGEVQSVAWTFDEQIVLCISTNKGLYQAIFPGNDYLYCGKDHHLHIETKLIPYPNGTESIKVLSNISPHPKGRLLVGVGIDSSGTRSLRLCDTLQKQWSTLSTGKLRGNISSILWTPTGEHLIFTSSEDMIAIDSFRWIARPYELQWNPGNVNIVSLSDQLLLASFSAQPDQLCPLFLVNTIDNDGPQISSIRRNKAGYIFDHKYKLSADEKELQVVRHMSVSNDGGYVGCSFSNSKGEPFPFVEIYLSPVDCLVRVCTLHRRGTSAEQLTIDGLKEMPDVYPLNFSFGSSFFKDSSSRDYAGSERKNAAFVSILWSDRSFTVHAI